MTESHLPPDADGALPGPAAGQPPGGPQGISPVAIASVACGIGALVLSVVWLAVLFIPMWGATGPPAVLFSAAPLGIGACIAAFVLGVVALIHVRRTRRRGAGQAVAGMVLGCAIPLLWLIVIVVVVAVYCNPSSKCF